MIDLRDPVFQWGQRVRAATDVVNDGSYPGMPAEAVLAPAGSEGEIVNIGHHAGANIPVYLVEFGGRMVVGCFEEELLAI